MIHVECAPDAKPARSRLPIYLGIWTALWVPVFQWSTLPLGIRKGLNPADFRNTDQFASFASAESVWLTAPVATFLFLTLAVIFAMLLAQRRPHKESKLMWALAAWALVWISGSLVILWHPTVPIEYLAKPLDYWKNERSQEGPRTILVVGLMLLGVLGSALIALSHRDALLAQKNG